MVEFVLGDDRQEPPGVEPKGRPIGVDRLDLDALAPLRFAQKPGDRQAAFTGGRPARGGDDPGVEPNPQTGIGRRFPKPPLVDHDQAPHQTDLRRRDADPGMGGERIDQIPRPVAPGVGVGIDRSGGRAQPGVRIMEHGADGHRRP